MVSYFFSICYWARIFIKSTLFLGGTTKSPFGPAQLKLGWIFQLTYGVGVTLSGMTWKRKNPVFAKAYIAKMTPKPCLSTWKWLSSIFKLVKQMEQLWVKSPFWKFYFFFNAKIANHFFGLHGKSWCHCLQKMLPNTVCK